jgi:hypothetical protein
MIDDKTPTGRDLDKALELEEARLSERVRMRLDSHEDEDSTVIEQRAAESVKASPTPPRYKLYQRIIDRLPPWGLVIVLLALLAAVVATGGTKLAGWW